MSNKQERTSGVAANLDAVAKGLALLGERLLWFVIFNPYYWGEYVWRRVLMRVLQFVRPCFDSCIPRRVSVLAYSVHMGTGKCD